jgi:hypothetical protein
MSSLFPGLWSFDWKSTKFVSQSSLKLPWYESCEGSILITYKFENGVQGPNHPNPARRYSGTTRYGYLPDNREGQKVLKLLKKASSRNWRSSASGANNVITWNDIHHKANVAGGPTKYVRNISGLCLFNVVSIILYFVLDIAQYSSWAFWQVKCMALSLIFNYIVTFISGLVISRPKLFEESTGRTGYKRNYRINNVKAR